jgi:hypothetical protein
MVSSTLETTKGKLPASSPFDLTAASSVDRQNLTNLIIQSIWSSPVENSRQGDLWIDYPFTESCNALGENSKDPLLARETKSRIAIHTEAIINEATQIGIDRGRARWAVDELITNASQYGAISAKNPSAGLIRVEWHADADSAGPSFALAVTNPCLVLFDPSRFARMEAIQFYSMENEGLNAHLGTVAMMSYIKQETKITYLWEMTSGERIRLTLEPIAENASDRPANYDELMKPTRVAVMKFDRLNRPVAYTFEMFQHDIEQKISAESVTVSCVLGGICPKEEL